MILSYIQKSVTATCSKTDDYTAIRDIILELYHGIFPRNFPTFVKATISQNGFAIDGLRRIKNPAVLS